jgi:hypothetical protein
MLLGITARAANEVLQRSGTEQLTEEARGRSILGKTLYSLTKPCELGAPMANYLLLTKGDVVYSSHEPVFISFGAIAACYNDVDPRFVERNVIIQDPKRRCFQKNVNVKKQHEVSDDDNTSSDAEDEDEEEKGSDTSDSDNDNITISSNVMSVWFERRATDEKINFANFLKTYKINRNRKTYTPYPQTRIIVPQGVELPDINKPGITTAEEEFYYLILLALFKPHRRPSDARKISNGSQSLSYKSAYQDFLTNNTMRQYADEALQFEEFNVNFRETSSNTDMKQHDIETDMIKNLPSLPKSNKTFCDKSDDSDSNNDQSSDEDDEMNKIVNVIPIPTEQDLGLIGINNLANAVLNTADISVNAYQGKDSKINNLIMDTGLYEMNIIDSNRPTAEQNIGTSLFLNLPLNREAKIQILRCYETPTPFHDSSHLGPPDTSTLQDFCNISEISIALRLNFGQHGPFDMYGRALLRSIVKDIQATDNSMKFSEQNSTPQMQLIGFIGGDAGVGKSAIIKGLLLLATKWKRRDLVETLAYTNIAACNIDGRTVHSARNISRSGEFQPGKLDNKSKQCISQVRLIIVDEFSMFWLALLGQLDNSTRLCTEPTMQSKAMGGKHLMLCGDLLQLPSTTNTPFYIEPTSSATISELQGWQLWQQINYIAFLTENKRQQNDFEFQDLLVKLRWGILDDKNIIRINEVCHSSTPLPTPPIRTDSSQPYEFLSPVIISKNTQRSAINRQTMLEIARSRNLPIYEILAEPTSNVKINQSKLNALQYLNEDHSGFIPILFRFILYMPFMTTERIQLTKIKSTTISKGTLGYILGFTTQSGNRFEDRIEDGVQIRRFTKIPSHLLVHIRDSTKQFVTTPNAQWKTDFKEGTVAIPASRLSLRINLSNSNVKVSREMKKAQIFNITALQFPLVPMYSCTVEKVQGLTIPDGITIGNLLRKGYKEQALYVAFTRALRLIQIRLVEALTASYLRNFKPNIAVAKQMIGLLKAAHIPNQPNHPGQITKMRNWLNQRLQYAQNLIDKETQPIAKAIQLKTPKPNFTLKQTNKNAKKVHLQTIYVFQMS